MSASFPKTVEGWTKIVNVLVEKGLITVRCTDHEYRSEDRDITHIMGKPVKGWLTVDGLPYNEDPEREVLMKLYYDAVGSKEMSGKDFS